MCWVINKQDKSLGCRDALLTRKCNRHSHKKAPPWCSGAFPEGGEKIVSGNCDPRLLVVDTSGRLFDTKISKKCYILAVWSNRQSGFTVHGSGFTVHKKAFRQSFWPTTPIHKFCSPSQFKAVLKPVVVKNLLRGEGLGERKRVVAGGKM